MECFCGCGRKIGLIQRTANSYGKTAKLLVSQLDELDFEDLPGHQFLREKGHEWFDAYAAATRMSVFFGSALRFFCGFLGFFALFSRFF